MVCTSDFMSWFPNYLLETKFSLIIIINVFVSINECCILEMILKVYHCENASCRRELFSNVTWS